MSESEMKNYLKESADSLGGRLFGVCRIDSQLRDTFHFEIKEVSEKLPTAISIGFPLAKPVLQTLGDRPNMLYKAHYRQVNAMLDNIAHTIAVRIQKERFQALPIPASMVLKRYPMTAHLSHREIAFRAGLGWWGRNNLLVNPVFGSQVRLVTILTNMELEPDPPLQSDCGHCRACITACPAGAIHEDKEKFDLKACSDKIQQFARENDYGIYICGLCLKACPRRE
jgi:epoxyqueuosine reductase